MTKIKNCTLLCADCFSYGKSVNALNKSKEQAEFDRVVFFTDIQIELPGIEVVQIPKISSKREYSHFIVKELYKYIDTDYVLIVQHDGYVLNGDQFDERLYDYDYCGALWPEIDGYANGNGGFSFRSKKLLEATGKDEMIKATHPEDAQICRTYRDYLEITYGLKWATDELCERFSFELKEPNQKTFGFHGNFHQPYRPTVILKRSGALGDIVMMEPVMRYYAGKGYNIVVDIPAEAFMLYNQHYFPVKHISQFDKGRISAEKIVDLDLAYEVKPRQSYQKSYFEFCGIPDYELTRPQLYPYIDEKTKRFKKYCVIHIDKRETNHRNIYGIDWKKVSRHLEALGFAVVQIGKGKHESIGIEYNTVNVGDMKHLIGGADLFIGVDSAPSHIAVAYNIPSIIFFGSVNPDYIHPDLTNVEIIQGNCDKSFCWHVTGGVSGKECEYKGTKKEVQCCISQWENVVDAINKLTQNK